MHFSSSHPGGIFAELYAGFWLLNEAATVNVTCAFEAVFEPAVDVTCVFEAVFETVLDVICAFEAVFKSVLDMTTRELVAPGNVVMTCAKAPGLVAPTCEDCAVEVAVSRSSK